MATINGLDVKKEIINVKLKSDECEALLSGFVRASMALTISREKGILLTLDCQTEFVREYIAALMMRRFKTRPKSDAARLAYSDCEKLLRTLGIFTAENELAGIPKRFEAYASAYVRGIFLGSGSFSARAASDVEPAQPTSGGYHIEFSFVSENFADEFAAFIAEYGISAHKMSRADKTVLYIKNSDGVSDCLALMRLDKLVLKLADTVTAMKFKKDVNRRLNCEMANITRTTDAAVEVSDAIEFIDAAVGIDSLSPKLLEAADARMNSPEKTLAELAYELGLSKSGLKHRFDSIILYALRLGYKNDRG